MLNVERSHLSGVSFRTDLERDAAQLLDTLPVVECFTAKYWSYVPAVSVAALGYAFGVPLLFGYLLFHFKEVGKAGDKVVQKALGWMPVCEP